MALWQADRLAALHHRDLEAAAARERDTRPRVPRHGRPARGHRLRYRLGILLVAAGTRLTVRDPGAGIATAHPRVP